MLWSEAERHVYILIYMLIYNYILDPGSYLESEGQRPNTT